ncbi:MAG: sigma-54-dependent Fis family transcriptional regulator [Magnetococcales bacterium]|nr:sigma-54-dependent Fis family transcriptional regulator [Magnetococcales bacterium]MBF0150061.1 sigma-54-dependent Fis family transcriptional regulator [Magnetococcales bacterium]
MADMNDMCLPLYPSDLEATKVLLNESIARIEAIKVHVLDSNLSEHGKQKIFNDLDSLRCVFLEAIAQYPLNDGRIQSQTVVARYGASPMILEGIIGHSEKMKNLLNVISKVAPSRLTVLFEGETGTGKELLARIVHLNSGRKKFIAINCGAFPPGIIESELFGHVKGSFTNAHMDRKGKFEEADGGTIFLDEIGDMDLAAQVKLLRVLEQGELQRVGSDQTHTIDVRVITATNRVLDDQVAEGKFREDLLYRINVCPLTVPPLRERRDEIEILLEFFIQEQQARVKQGVPRLSAELKKFFLHDYDFPGNIRELKNIAQYILVTSGTREMTVKDLPERYQRAFARVMEKAERIENSGSTFDAFDVVVPTTGGVAVARHEAERQYLVGLLAKYRGAVAKVCTETGLSRARVYQLMKKFSLHPSEFRHAGK